jgi:glycosyltransferase involved in cell wall biosynthesis
MEKKKVVCHITTVHIPKDIRIYHKECKSLADAGYDVKLVVVNAGDAVSDYNGVEIINVDVDTSSKVKRVINASKKARLVAETLKADIYHFHDPEFLFEARKLRKRGFKVIYDVHEDVPRQIMSKAWIPKPMRKLISLTMRLIEWTIVQDMSAVVTVVQTIVQRFSKINQKIELIQNFPQLEVLPEPADWSLKNRQVCYVGDYTRIRGINELLIAIAQNGKQLTMAGRWSDKSLARECEERGFPESFEELGFVTRDEVQDVYVRAKIGTVLFHPVPNHMDALPNKLFEYMAAGIPIIASDFGWLKKIVEEFNCGIAVNPKKPEEIAKAIDWLIDNDEEAQKMGQRGREAVVENYNWATEEKKLLSLYDSLLSQ